MTENPLNMGVLLRKRVSLVCSTLRSRSLQYKHRLVQEVSTFTTHFIFPHIPPTSLSPQFAGHSLPLFGEGGLLRVPIHQIYPLDQASLAHSTMRENKNIGKLILEI